MRKLLGSIIIALALLASAAMLVWHFNPGMYKNAILAHIPFVKDMVQQEFKTYTSITAIQEEMKLVTAKQNLDFITVLEGKDGSYIEIATYEVKAGIDCAKITKDEEGGALLPPAEIFSADKINPLLLRNANKTDAAFYEGYVKPVNTAYQQKARDYAVELHILEKAREKAQDVFSSITGSKPESAEGEGYLASADVPFLPLKLSFAPDFLAQQHIVRQSQPSSSFSRDAMVFMPNNNVDNWTIRIGYTGMTYNKTFAEFYKNMYDTNTAEANTGRDRVEMFRYFDPLYPKEAEILSYASDYYRTFFLLSGGKIYYVDAVCENEQTLAQSLSPVVIYLASSLHAIGDRRIERSGEYQAYIESYRDASRLIRDAADAYALDGAVSRLLPLDVLAADGKRTRDELYIQAVADLLNRRNAVSPTGDAYFDSVGELYLALYSPDTDFSQKDTRDKLLRTMSTLNSKIAKESHTDLYLPSYLRGWFVQNQKKFGIDRGAAAEYVAGIRDIVSRDAIVDMSDAERNEYYYTLFLNKIKNSRLYVDTADKAEDLLKKSVHGETMFVYFDIPTASRMLVDGEVEERLRAINGGRETGENKFVFVFNQHKWDWGPVKNDDIHAIVLDDATVRFFPNIENNVLESIKEKFDFLFNKDKRVEYFYFGDWKKLLVSADGIQFGGRDFSTARLTKKGKAEYRNTDDFREKSAIGLVLADFQHAYSAEDADYYYETIRSAVLDYVRYYVYNELFRPSPRMLLETDTDEMRRYNY